MKDNCKFHFLITNYLLRYFYTLYNYYCISKFDIMNKNGIQIWQMPYKFVQKYLRYTYKKTFFRKTEWKMQFLDLVWQSFHFRLKSLKPRPMNFLNQTRFLHSTERKSRKSLKIYYWLNHTFKLKISIWNASKTAICA